MQEFKKRLCIEYFDLRDRLEKLSSFIGGEVFNNLEDEERENLIAQRNSMDVYLQVLSSRMDYYGLFSDSVNYCVDFGRAIKALKAGKRVQRAGWNAKGSFVFRQVPSLIGKDIIPKMQSLPDSVKEMFSRSSDLEFISYENQLALVDSFNRISGWAPSASDALAEDWMILD